MLPQASRLWWKNVCDEDLINVFTLLMMNQAFITSSKTYHTTSGTLAGAETSFIPGKKSRVVQRFTLRGYSRQIVNTQADIKALVKQSQPVADKIKKITKVKAPLIWRENAAQVKRWSSRDFFIPNTVTSSPTLYPFADTRARLRYIN